MVDRWRVVVSEQQAGLRFDKLVVQATGLGRGAAKRLFAAGHVELVGADGRRRRTAKGDVVRVGDVVTVQLADDCRSLAEAAQAADEPVAQHPTRVEPAAVPDPSAPLQIVYESAALVVVDKPAGQPTAPLSAAEGGAVANALVARYPEMGGIGYRPLEPGLCHRLDTNTSGLLLAARTAAAFRLLTTAILDGRVDKRYLLLCGGAERMTERGSIDFPLAPHPKNRKKVLVCRYARDERHRSRPALTHYKVLRRSGPLALVEARARRAGRHQLRAHFGALGHPIVGDVLYGSNLGRHLGRHALHASFVGFVGEGPIEALRLRSKLPRELRALLDQGV